MHRLIEKPYRPELYGATSLLGPLVALRERSKVNLLEEVVRPADDWSTYVHIAERRRQLRSAVHGDGQLTQSRCGLLD